MLDRTVPRRPVRGAHNKATRNAKPVKADPLPTTHADFVSLTISRKACTPIEQTIVQKRNAGSHWEKIAVDTGYTLTTVRQKHRSAQQKVTAYRLPRRAPDQAKPGYVYFLRSEDHIKIGYAVDVAARMKELQCGNPARLQLLGVIAAAPADERAMHQRFSESREEGEWFRRSRALLDFIESTEARRIVMKHPAVIHPKQKHSRRKKMPSHEQMLVIRARQADPPVPWAELAAERGLSHGEVRRMHGRAERLLARQQPNDV
jgi:hypothetical protein